MAEAFILSLFLSSRFLKEPLFSASKKNLEKAEKLV